METHSLLVCRWEDVVFENRNKEYGAYLLRKAYGLRLLIGLGFTIALVAIMLLVPDYATDIKRNDGRPRTNGPTILNPEPIIERERPKDDVRPPKMNKKNTQILVTREVVEDTVVTDDPIEVSHERFDVGALGSLEGTGTAPQVEVTPVVAPDFVDIAQVMPAYEGGMEGIMKFIQKKIRFPRGPKSIGVDGTVYVRFIVNGDGSVSDLEVIKGVHPDYDKEAMRVIAMMPSWKGGRNNGLPVAVRMVLPLKFNLKQ